jgi:Thioesterase-like superfamily
VVGLTDAFFEPLGGDRYRATPHTRGPWDAAHQHAGPPAALLGRAVERCAPRPEMAIARLTYEILRPVPVGELEVAARVIRPGRSVELLEAELSADGTPLVLVRAWRVLVTEAPAIGAAPVPLPRPADASPLPPYLQDFGYGHAVELRFAAGAWEEPGPATVWTRLRVAVVEGEEPTGLQRVLAVADSGNGVSGVLALTDWLYINPELTVHVRREPRGEWICLDAETTIADTGLARSTLSDDHGPVAHGAQSLFVAPRR